MDADEIAILKDLLDQFDRIQLVSAGGDGDVITAAVYSSKETFKEIKYHADLIPNERIRAKVHEIDVSYDDIYGLYEAHSDLKPAINELRRIISKENQGEPHEFKYFSKRKGQKQNDTITLAKQMQSLFQYYKERDYFLEKLTIESKNDIPQRPLTSA
jgi:hypothetical protein